MKNIILILIVSGCSIQASSDDTTPPLTQGYREKTQQEYDALLKKKEEIQDKIDHLFAIGNKIVEQDTDNTVEARVWNTLTDKLMQLKLEKGDVEMDLKFAKVALDVWDSLSKAQATLARYSQSLSSLGSHIQSSTNSLDNQGPSTAEPTTTITKSPSTEKPSSDTSEMLRIFCLSFLGYISLSYLTSTH